MINTVIYFTKSRDLFGNLYFGLKVGKDVKPLLACVLKLPMEGNEYGSLIDNIKEIVKGYLREKGHNPSNSNFKIQFNKEDYLECGFIKSNKAHSGYEYEITDKKFNVSFSETEMIFFGEIILKIERV